MAFDRNCFLNLGNLIETIEDNESFAEPIVPATRYYETTNRIGNCRRESKGSQDDDDPVYTRVQVQIVLRVLYKFETLLFLPDLQPHLMQSVTLPITYIQFRSIKLTE